MFSDIPKVVSHHWKERNINWPMMIYISIVHAAASYGVYKATQCSYQTLLWAFCLWPIRYVIVELKCIASSFPFKPAPHIYFC
jgi:hypothetical protein